jgi:hypothetical protein
MVAPNNALLYNAAIEGLVAGAIKGRWLTKKNSGTPPAIGTPDAAYAALATQAVQLANEFDAAVPNDHAGAAQPTGTQAISVVTTGVAIVPSTGAIQFGQIEKSRLMSACAINVLEGRPYTAIPSAELSGIATGVAALYLAAAAAIEQPQSALVSVNNQLLLYSVYAGMIAGANLGTDSSNPASDFTSLEAYAISLAVAVDALITNDAGISNAAGTGNGGSAIAPEPDTGFVIQLNQLGKTRLMYSCTLAYLEGRSPPSITGATTGTITAWGVSNAGPIAALYKAGLVNLKVVPVNLFNPELWNQAYCGYIEGVMAGRPFHSSSSTAPHYVAVAAAAAAFATEIDTTVGAIDVAGTPVPVATQAISVNVTEGPTTNSDIVPTTGTITEGQIAKGGIMWAICRGVMWGRNILGITAEDNVAATYLNIANSVVALYLELATILNTP